jgi:hypothetical protein
VGPAPPMLDPADPGPTGFGVELPIDSDGAEATAQSEETSSSTTQDRNIPQFLL